LAYLLKKGRESRTQDDLFTEFNKYLAVLDGHNGHRYGCLAPYSYVKIKDDDGEIFSVYLWSDDVKQIDPRKYAEIDPPQWVERYLTFSRRQEAPEPTVGTEFRF
jgi:hypothetical protein